jgi:hypothetical protein
MTRDEQLAELRERIESVFPLESFSVRENDARPPMPRAVRRASRRHQHIQDVKAQDTTSCNLALFDEARDGG